MDTSRMAFRLRIKPDCIVAYEEAHKRVWPELLALLKGVGISDYSIFRRGTELFFYMKVADFERAWNEIDKSPVNARWQQEMSALFDEPDAIGPGERFPMMREVFYLK